MQDTETIKSEKLLEEIRIALKDLFVAAVRKRGDEVVMEFPNGQKFAVTVWEEKQ